MAPNRLLATGIIGIILSVLGCVTPALFALLAALGISGSAVWLDYVLLPAIAVFTCLTSLHGRPKTCFLRRKVARALHASPSSPDDPCPTFRR